MHVRVAFVVSFLAFLRLSIEGNTGFAAGSELSAVVIGKLIVRGSTILILGAYLLPRLSRLSQYMAGPAGWMLLFFVLAGASVMYSPDPFNSAFRLVEHFTYLLFAVALSLSARTESEGRLSVDLVLVGCSLLVGTVWLGVALAPEFAFRRLGSTGVDALGGDILHIHTLGIAAALVALVSGERVIARAPRRLLWCVQFGLMTVTVVMARSRASLGILLCGGLWILLRAKAHRLTAAACVAAAGLWSVGHVDLASLRDFVYRGQSAEELTTLSARTVVWDRILSHTLAERPLMGFGYQMLSETGVELAIDEYGYRSNAHNTIIQTFAGLGVLGVMLLGIVIASSARALCRRWATTVGQGREELFELSLIGGVCLAASVTEFGIVGMTTPVVPAFMVVLVQLGRREDSRRRQWASAASRLSCTRSEDWAADVVARDDRLGLRG